ncbi:MAG: class I SAM-dependent methyltransferase [Acidimicrobiales bacterium]
MDDRHERTRRSYDAVAADYAEHLAHELDYKPFDRALLASLVEQAPPGLAIADLGCGPGHVAGWLANQGGPQAVGIDLSPKMVALAAALNPGASFREGDLCALPAADAEFGAAVALYSIIHLAPEELPQAFGEMHRCLAAGGLLLVAFHVGTEVNHSDEWWGHDVDVDFRFLEVEPVVEVMEAAGFSIKMKATRVAYPEEAATERAYLLARRA